MFTSWAVAPWRGRRVDMGLRPATEADLPALVRLNSGVLELHARNAPNHFNMPNAAGTGPTALFREVLGRTNSCLVAAEEEGLLSGIYLRRKCSAKKAGVVPRGARSALSTSRSTRHSADVASEQHC